MKGTSKRKTQKPPDPPRTLSVNYFSIVGWWGFSLSGYFPINYTNPTTNQVVTKHLSMSGKIYFFPSSAPPFDGPSLYVAEGFRVNHDGVNVKGPRQPENSPARFVGTVILNSDGTGSFQLPNPAGDPVETNQINFVLVNNNTEMLLANQGVPQPPDVSMLTTIRIGVLTGIAKKV